MKIGPTPLRRLRMRVLWVRWAKYYTLATGSYSREHPSRCGWYSDREWTYDAVDNALRFPEDSVMTPGEWVSVQLRGGFELWR